MNDHIPISYLNDFIFCPYSIYLHQIFDEGESETFSAAPQQKGKTAHTKIDSPNPKSRGMRGIYVISDGLQVFGKIDVFYPDSKRLVEYKRQIRTLFKGFYYQIWAQCFCLTEMGFAVESLELVSMIDKKRTAVDLPGKAEFEELSSHVRNILDFDPDTFNEGINPNKCRHCIYSSLCDKTEVDHVYS